MQTIFYKTTNFIRHSGNVVDLDEYRRKTALAQEDNLARQPEEPSFQPVGLIMSKEERRKQRWERWACMLDACASGAVVVLTVAFFILMQL